MIKFRLAVAIFAFALAGVAQAQTPPTAPPGFPKGPQQPHDLYASKSGEVLLKLSSKGRSTVKKKFKAKYGRNPSSHQFDQFLAKLLGLRKSSKLKDGKTLHVKGRRTNDAKIARARKDGLLETVEKNYQVFALFDLNDLLFKLNMLWGLENSGFPLGTPDIDINAAGAWQITTGDPSLVVAVIDTGVALLHPDLAGNIFKNPAEPINGLDDDGNGFIDDASGWDFINNDSDPDDDMFHGSHVAGTIAAGRGDAGWSVGVAPTVKILPLKILAADGSGDTKGLIEAIDYATSLRKKGVNLRVINASLGGGEHSPLVEDAIKRAGQAGILFVAAAGNDGSDNDETPVYPASYGLANVISVAAIDSHGNRSDFSNFGVNSVDIAAPGSDIWSTIIAGLYLPSSGTSMATPHVAGVAALVWSTNPGLSPAQVKARITGTATRLQGLDGLIKVPGLVNAQAALLNKS